MRYNKDCKSILGTKLTQKRKQYLHNVEHV